MTQRIFFSWNYKFLGPFLAVFGPRLKITLGAKTMPAPHFFQKVRLSYEKITKNAQPDQFLEWTFSVWLFNWILKFLWFMLPLYPNFQNSIKQPNGTMLLRKLVRLSVFRYFFIWKPNLLKKMECRHGFGPERDFEFLAENGPKNL